MQEKSTIYETGENYSNEICVNRIKQPPWNLSVSLRNTMTTFNCLISITTKFNTFRYLKKDMYIVHG